MTWKINTQQGVIYAPVSIKLYNMIIDHYLALMKELNKENLVEELYDLPKNIAGLKEKVRLFGLHLEHIEKKYMGIIHEQEQNTDVAESQKEYENNLLNVYENASKN